MPENAKCELLVASCCSHTTCKRTRIFLCHGLHQVQLGGDAGRKSGVAQRQLRGQQDAGDLTPQLVAEIAFHRSQRRRLSFSARRNATCASRTTRSTLCNDRLT